jgi:hypothetical protein
MYLTSFRSTFLWLAFLREAYGQTYYGPIDQNIDIELTLNVPSNGISTTPDGRLFLVYARVDGSKGPQVVEYNRETNTSTAYPNEEWNSYEPGKNPARHFLGVNSQRVGPDGKLWIVDKGATALGSPVSKTKTMGKRRTRPSGCQVQFGPSRHFYCILPYLRNLLTILPVDLGGSSLRSKTCSSRCSDKQGLSSVSVSIRRISTI